MRFLYGVTLALQVTPAPDANPAADSSTSQEDLISSIQELVTAERLTELLFDYGPKLLSAIAVFLIGKWLARFVTGLIIRTARKARVDDTLLSFLRNLVYVLLLTAVCISALGCLGVNTTSLSAVLAAAGFAVGMALQGSLGNLASGVMLVLFKPFAVGDFVEVSGNSGKITEIQIFNTILLTPDNIRIIVPNGSITSGTIRNFSAEPRRRIDLVIGCGYNDDLREVKSFLQNLLAQESRILTEPEPAVAVSELANSSVNFVVRPWVSSSDYWQTRCDLLERIKLGFDEQGFTIPFPSQDLFIHNADAV